MDDDNAVVTEVTQNGGGNSKGSTGPRTALGKRRSSRNSAQHGVLSKTLLTDEPFFESAKDYNAVFESLLERYPDPDAREIRHIRCSALDYIRLERTAKLDTQLFPDMFRRLKDSLSEEGSGFTTEVVDKGSEVAGQRRELNPELLMHCDAGVRKSIEWNQKQLDCLRRAREAAAGNERATLHELKIL